MGTQGQSDHTWFKQYRFSPVLAQSLRISKAQSVANYAFYHIDLNSGGGFNEEVQVEGSPLNFLSAVDRCQRHNFYVFFVDENPMAIRTLTKRLEHRADISRINIFESDNSEILPIVSEFIAARERNPYLSIGSILVDPNGYHKGVPWSALEVFCRSHPRFDVFLNLNTRTYRLERPHVLQGKGDWAKYQYPKPPSLFPKLFHRPNWMITEQTGNRWIQCVGRTLTTAQKGYESLGFYDSHSERGRRIIAELDKDDDTEAGSVQLLLLPEL